jgi:hypothetical protein
MDEHRTTDTTDGERGALRGARATALGNPLRADASGPRPGGEQSSELFPCPKCGRTMTCAGHHWHCGACGLVITSAEFIAAVWRRAERKREAKTQEVIG